MRVKESFCCYFENSYCPECPDRQQTANCTNFALSLASFAFFENYVCDETPLVKKHTL